MGVIGEAAERAERDANRRVSERLIYGGETLGRQCGGIEEAAQEAVEAHLLELDAEAGFAGPLSLDGPLTSRRAGGDAGHVPGCARDHALDTACGTRPLPVEADLHEAGLRRVQAARVALRENLRAAYALGEAQVATVLRVADALGAGLSLEAREALGREADESWFDAPLTPGAERPWRYVGERLFALGRASVVPPNPELALVIAAWSHISPSQREHVRRSAIARAWSTTLGRVRQALWEAGDVLSRTTIDCGFADDGLRLISVTIDGDPATGEQWAKLRGVGVPVPDGVGV